MIAASLVPDGTGGDNDAAVFNSLIQHSAVAEKDQLFQTHGNQILKVTDAGRLPYPGFKEGDALSLVFHGVNRRFSVGAPYAADPLRPEEG